MLSIIGIVYDKNSLTRKRVIISDQCDEDIHAHKHNLLPDEKFMTIPLETYKNFTKSEHIDAHVASVLGTAK